MQLLVSVLLVVVAVCVATCSGVSSDSSSSSQVAKGLLEVPHRVNASRGQATCYTPVNWRSNACNDHSPTTDVAAIVTKGADGLNCGDYVCVQCLGSSLPHHYCKTGNALRLLIMDTGSWKTFDIGNGAFQQIFYGPDNGGCSGWFDIQWWRC
eukprot:TRINITY_DN10455_c0_g2_i1.p1 TRINITY_DN10455_c0_g2~~TRINITY_DN10455_c0_g2_i1.p1  ORF type:complete len:153 (-),score=12.50 TRINITY_DN10455_c0_g2_i1:43-501(-)